MSGRGYGAVREYKDDPGLDNRDDAQRRSAAGIDSSSSFSSAIDEISSSVFQISNNVSTLERQMNDIGTSRDSQNLRQRIHDQEQKTNKIVVSCTQQFKKLARQRAPNRQCKIQIERLKSDFEDTIQRYNRLQKLVAARVKTTPPLQSILIDIDETDDKAELLRNDERRSQLQTQALVVDQDLAMIQEREEQIRQLEGDIININEIFRDLASLVYEQGEMVDSIEANVEKGYDNVEQGNRQLEQASHYATKYRKKLCCFATVIGVIAAIVVIILIVELRK